MKKGIQENHNKKLDLKLVLSCTTKDVISKKKKKVRFQKNQRVTICSKKKVTLDVVAVSYVDVFFALVRYYIKRRGGGG